MSRFLAHEIKNILFLGLPCFGGEDACQAFQRLGYKVLPGNLSDKAKQDFDPDYVEALQSQIQKNQINLVFSFNYYPTVSEACEPLHIPYLSWIFDSPVTKVYFKQVTYACNHVYTFDSHMMEDLNRWGAGTVSYAPLAANPARMASVKVLQGERSRYQAEVSFVGALYNEDHNFYHKLMAALDEYTQGYVNGLIEAQTDIYGCDLMTKAITPSIVNVIDRVMPYETNEGFLAPRSYIYSQYYLARQVTFRERFMMINVLSSCFPMKIYTLDPHVQVGKAVNCGIADYYKEMPKVFQCTKININQTLKSIYTGIPLRAWDIMGCGGFLLTNFQEDFMRHFEPDVDFVYYTSMEEMAAKADYYLRHDTEREAVRLRGLKRVKQEHTFEIRLKNLLEAVAARKE